jgi:hypothetical protein
MLPFASPASDGDPGNAARLAKLAEIDTSTPVTARPRRRGVDGRRTRGAMKVDRFAAINGAAA